MYANFQISSMFLTLFRIRGLHGGAGGHLWFLTRYLMLYANPYSVNWEWLTNTLSVCIMSYEVILFAIFIDMISLIFMLDKNQPPTWPIFQLLSGYILAKSIPNQGQTFDISHTLTHLTLLTHLDQFYHFVIFRPVWPIRPIWLLLVT